MSFTESIKSVFSKYATFSGRARRSEYWYFALFVFIVDLILSTVLGAISQKLGQTLSSLFSLAILIPSLAVCCRRLHDIGKSGWLQLLALIPVVGWIILIIWAAKDSDPGENQYGANPKG